jgi:predicted amidophosphoribosyltransferase
MDEEGNKKNLLKKNPNVKKCPFCGAVINHDDAVCHNCLHPIPRFKDETHQGFTDNDSIIN